MPDLLTHILFILIVCELANLKKKSLLLIGAILPDIITKIFLFGFIVNLPKEVVDALILFHSILPMLLLSVLIGLFFKDLFYAAYMISAGALSHLLLDILNAHIYAGTKLLFPFSWDVYRINAMWPDQYWMLLIGLFVAYAVIKGYKFAK